MWRAPENENLPFFVLQFVLTRYHPKCHANLLFLQYFDLQIELTKKGHSSSSESESSHAQDDRLMDLAGNTISILGRCQFADNMDSQLKTHRVRCKI